MAAVTYSLLNAAEGGGRILTTTQLYGGTVDSFKKVYRPYGIVIDNVAHGEDAQSFAAAIKEDTKAIFVESISNPNAVVTCSCGESFSA